MSFAKVKLVDIYILLLLFDYTRNKYVIDNEPRVQWYHFDERRLKQQNIYKLDDDVCMSVCLSV